MPRGSPSSPSGRPPRSHGRRVARLGGIVAAVVLALILIGVISLHTPPVKRHVLSQVIALLADRQIGARADALDYNLLDLTLELRNVTVRSDQAPDLPAFARIARLRVDLGLFALLRGRYVVEDGALDGLDLHVVVDADGRDNLPRPPQPQDEPAGEAPDYLVERFVVSSARVRYQDRQQRIDAVLPVALMTVEGNRITERHTIQFTAQDGTVQLQDGRTAIQRLAGTLDVGRDDLDVLDLTLQAPGARLTLSGAVNGFDAPELDLTARGEVALEDAAAFAGQAEPVDGVVRASVAVRGPVDALTVGGTLDGSNLRVRTLRDMHLAAAGTYDGGTGRVTIDDLRLRGPVGRLEAQGAVALDAGAGESHVRASMQALDLAALMRAADLEYVVASRASGQVSASWPGLDYPAAAGGARLSVEPAGAAAPHVVPVGGTIAVDARDRRLVAQLSDVRALGATADAHVALEHRGRLSGAATLRVGDLAGVVSAAEAVLGREPGTLVGTTVSGAAVVEARLGGTADAPAADLALSAPSVTVGQAADMHVKGAVSYSPRAVGIRELDVIWQEARAHVKGSVGLQGARPLALEVTAEQIPVPEVLRALDREDPVSGVVGVTGTIGGTVDRPRGQVALRAADLAAYGEPIGLLTADVRLDDQSLARADLRLEKPQPDDTGVLTATGTYHLDDRRFDLEIDSARVRLVSLMLPGDVPVRGALDLEVQAHGTLDDPVATANLVVDDLRVREDQLGRVAVHAEVADRHARVGASADRFTLDASADIALVDAYPATVTMSLHDLDLGALPLPPDMPLAGRLRAHVEGSGDLSRPEAGSAAATLEALTASWNGQPITLEDPATLRYADERIAIDRLVVNAQNSTVSLAGDLPLDARTGRGTLDFSVRLDLPALATYAPPEMELKASGTAALAGRITGSLQAIDPTLTLTVDQASVSSAALQPGLTDIRARLETSNGELRLPVLSGAFGPARIEATGHVPLAVLAEDLPVELPRADGPAALRAEVTGLDLATLPGRPDGLAGAISVAAEVSATRADLAALSGRIVFPVLQVQINDLAFAQEGTSTIVIDDGIASIEQLALAGSAGRLEVQGAVGLGGERALDVSAGGRIDIAAISAFTDAVRAEGPVTLELAATGTVGDPALDGFIELTDASASSSTPRVVLEDLNARVDLSRQRAVLSRLSGTLNGGELSGSGAIELGEGTIADIDLGATVSGMALDTPLNLRSLLDAEVRVEPRGELFVIGGQVKIEEAGLTQDLHLDTGLLAALAAPRQLDLTTARDPFLERVRFDVSVSTATPILLDNNLARAEVTADLRVLGTPYEPGMSGRLVLEEDSVITLNERPYIVERGIITFVEEQRIAPVFDLRLTTRANRYDVALEVTGAPGNTETTLTSDPALPEPDILALLVTGRTLEEMRGEEYEIARTQVMSYVTGRAGSSLGRGLERATGLSRVRLEPNLIAGEADPGARLTVGQDLTDDLSLIYSTDLVNSADQIWVAEYDVTRRFQTRTVRQSDASYRFDVRHDVRFGGSPEPRRTAPRNQRFVGEVRVEGEPGLGMPEILQRFGVKAGNVYSFFDVRRGVQRVEELYRRAGLLQARVRVRPSDEGDRVHLTLAITAGPRVDIAFDGASPPPGVQQQVALLWHRGVFDTQRANDGQDALRKWLIGRNHLTAQVRHSIEERSPDHRLVTFQIDPGPQFDRVVLAFDGAGGIDASVLDDIVNEQRLESALFTDPARVTGLLERYYHEQGYLAAEIDEPRLEFSGSEARIVLTIREGPQFTIRRVDATDTRALSSEVLLSEVPLEIGDPYLPAVAERSVTRIRELYGARGYNDARASYVLGVDRDGGEVDVTFAIDEGLREVVAAIEVEGHEKTSAVLVQRQLAIAPGAPLAIADLGQSRRNLYDTRAFALVDLTREEVPSGVPGGTGGVRAEATAGPTAAGMAVNSDKPVRVTAAVREVQPYQIRYGGFYDTERGFGGIVDLSNHNSLGRARVAGLRTRFGSQLREARIYLSQPSLTDLPRETIANVFYSEERHPATAGVEPFNVDRFGVSLQQEAQLRDNYVWNYGYRFERARTFDPRPGGTLDETANISPLTSTLTRETRDDVLDATRGQFLSHALSFSPAFLGSDVPYIKYLGQYFVYRALEPERRERFTNEILRPRFVYAAGVRVGLAQGFRGGELPLSERFLAGGSTTLRGFSQNAVGPIGPDGLPLGGQAMLIVNNELRFPLFGRFDGAAFVDIGNVFENVSDFSFGDLRKSGGLGLRLRTPWFLGRLDYGVPLDRRPGESRSRFFFSIGQAF